MFNICFNVTCIVIYVLYGLYIVCYKFYCFKPAFGCQILMNFFFISAWQRIAMCWRSERENAISNNGSSKYVVAQHC